MPAVALAKAKKGAKTNTFPRQGLNSVPNVSIQPSAVHYYVSTNPVQFIKIRSKQNAMGVNHGDLV